MVTNLYIHIRHLCITPLLAADLCVDSYRMPHFSAMLMKVRIDRAPYSRKFSQDVIASRSTLRVKSLFRPFEAIVAES